MKHLKPILCLVMVLALTVITFGCAPAQDPPAETPSAAPETSGAAEPADSPAPAASEEAAGAYVNEDVTNDDRGTRPFGDSFGGRSVAAGNNGMATSSSTLASETAIEILKKGGSAVDAAIAANAILHLVEPHMCGVGGDMFAIIYDPATGKLDGLNASGTSSASVSYDDLTAKLGTAEAMPNVGPYSVTVPGVVDGWTQMHEKYGKLPLSEVLAPAIKYAKEGVVITESESALWDLGLVELMDLGADEAYLGELKSIFYPNGKAPAVGETFANPALAKTYELIAQKGRAGFYEGGVAKGIVEVLAKYGATMTMEDLANYKSEWVEPISTNYRGYDVYEIPPNGHGLTALEFLNIAENFDLASMGRKSADFWHVFIEAKKLAYEDRPSYAADMRFNDDLPIEQLLSKDYAKQRAALIDMDKANLNVTSGVEPNGKGDTTYLAVADSSGMMVSLIQSVYGLMGSGVAVEEYGFALQNRGSLFSLDKNSPNVYEPGKRPFHTIIPAFVMKDSKPYMAFGVCGGDYQPMGHAQFLVNHIDFGMDIQDAIDAARIRHKGQTDPATGVVGEDGFMAELGIREDIIQGLLDKGHTFIRQDPVASDLSGTIHAIMFDAATGSYFGASEMRADGAAIGY